MQGVLFHWRLQYIPETAAIQTTWRDSEKSVYVVSSCYKGWFQSARAGSPTQNNTPLARGKGKKLHVASEGSHKKQAVCKDEIWEFKVKHSILFPNSCSRFAGTLDVPLWCPGSLARIQGFSRSWQEWLHVLHTESVNLAYKYFSTWCGFCCFLRSSRG